MTYRIFTNYKLIGEFTDFFAAYFEYCKQMSGGAHLVQFYGDKKLYSEYIVSGCINR